MTLFIGIDPGKSGALAALDQGGIIRSLQPTPIIPGQKGARDEYDIPASRSLLAQFKATGVAVVTLEQLQPLPPKMGGVITNFQRGAGLYLWIGLLVGLEMPYQLVHPRTWQKTMHSGLPKMDTKQASLIQAQRRWPSQTWKRTARSQKDDDGLADAALIAEYGRRNWGLQEEDVA